MARRILLIDIGSGLTLQGLIPSVALYGTQTGSVKAGNGVPPYTYTLSAGVLPAGVYLDAGTGLLSGSPTEAGSFPITVKATDLSGASVQRAFVLTVIAEPLTLSGSAPDGSVGVAQSYTYAVAGGVPPYTYSLVDAPDGWSIPDTGEPTIEYTATSSGAKTWTVRATDAIGGQFDLADAAMITAPALTLSGAFSGATLGVGYSSDLAIAGGDGAYSNPRVTAGSLSGTGLSLSIVGSALRLSGTPTGSATTLDITVAVDSGDGQTASSAQEIVIGLAKAWSAADKNASIALSSNNTVAKDTTTTTSWKCVRGEVQKSSGKWYFEVDQNTGVGTAGFTSHAAGVGKSGASLSAYPGSDANAWAHLGDGYKAHAGYSSYGYSWGVGDRFMVAVDIDAGKIWFGVNGTWFDSGDPETGANPAFTGLTGGIYPIAGLKNNDSLRLVLSLSYGPPAGFSAWM